MGVGDKESGTAGGAKREISSSLSRGINAKRLCTRLKKKDMQMCELKYEKKIDPKTANFAKMRVKELKKICDDEGIDVKGVPRPRLAHARACSSREPRWSSPRGMPALGRLAPITWSRRHFARRADGEGRVH